jgi:pimeloyl-ACP methyl ester carboxylesterase
MSLTRPLPGRAFLQGATALAVLSSVASGATRRNLATGKEGMVLVGVGLAEYRAEFAAALSALPPQPVILGHSMGAVLAQQLAA